MAKLPEHPRCPHCGSTNTERHWGDQLMQFGAGFVTGLADNYFLGGTLSSSNADALSKGVDEVVDSFSQKYTCNKCGKDFTLYTATKDAPAKERTPKSKGSTSNHKNSVSPTASTGGTHTDNSKEIKNKDKQKKKFLKDLYSHSQVTGVKISHLPDNKIIEIGSWHGLDASESLQISGKNKPITNANVSTPISSTPSVKPNIAENEQSYLEEYKQCLEDGDISTSEIRLLSKLAKSLGISEERARELEASLTKPQLVLTAEEEGYLTEYKDAVADGELTATSRRLLNKIRVSIGISEERAQEIENSLK